ncbi:MAG: hypothetical protein ACPIOQ_07620, partial [Promethearchaeia archaeon]
YRREADSFVHPRLPMRFLSLALFFPVARVARSLSLAVSVTPCLVYTSTHARTRMHTLSLTHTHTGTTLQRL